MHFHPLKSPLTDDPPYILTSLCRNTSTAFSLASGTIGATLSSTLSGVKSIAVSYAIFDKTYSAKAVDLANEIACNVAKRLYEDWGKDGGLVGGEVGLYTVRLLSPFSLSPKGNMLTLLLLVCGRSTFRFERRTCRPPNTSSPEFGTTRISRSSSLRLPCPLGRTYPTRPPQPPKRNRQRRRRGSSRLGLHLRCKGW